MSWGSLRVRLIGFLLLGGFLPVCVLAFFLLWFVRAELHEGLTRQLDISTDFLAARVSREMLLTLKVVRDLSRDPLLDAEPESVLRRTIAQAEVGTAGTSHRPLLVALELAAPDGSVRAQWPHRLAPRILHALQQDTSNPLGGTSSVQGAPGPRVAATGPEPRLNLATSAAGNLFAPDSQPPFIVLTLPRSVGRGGAGGSLRAVLDLAAISDLIAREKPPGGLEKEILIYEVSGRILARLDPSRGLLTPVLARYQFLGTTPGVGRGAISDPRGDRSAIYAVKTLLGSGYPAPLDTIDWRLAAVQPLDDPSEETVSLIAGIQRGMIAAAAVALIASLVLASILLRSILLPLAHLDDGTRRVAAGDLNSPIPILRDDELGRLAGVFNEMTDKIRTSTARLVELSATDALTGLANRRVFAERLEHELKRSARYKHSLSLAVMDIDHFKNFNDTYGHAFGDCVLREVARTAKSICRDTDFLARYGGEEMVFILPETTLENAVKLMERVRIAIESHKVADEASHVTAAVTVSIGVAAFPANKDSLTNLFALADFALYQAKKAGRNRVLASPDLAEPAT